MNEDRIRCWYCACRIHLGTLLVLSVVLVAGATAAPVLFVERGPCPDAADGVCVPNRRNFGFYATRWRPWPGDRPVAPPTGPAAPRAVPPAVHPFDLPRPEEEENFGQPRKPLVGLAPELPGEVPGQTPREQEKDAAPKPPLDSEDIPPVPPASLRENRQRRLPAGVPSRATPPTRPPATRGGLRSPRGAQLPFPGQARSAGLAWRQVTPATGIEADRGNFRPSPRAVRNPRANPLRAASRPAVDIRPVTNARPAQPAPLRQVVYTASLPPRSPDRGALATMRANPLRPRR